MNVIEDPFTLGMAQVVFQWNKFTYEPARDKNNKKACAPSEDPDQPGHSPSLISLRCPHEEGLDP